MDKRQQERDRKADFKRIEARIEKHVPKSLRGIDILHEHKGQKIIFVAWKNDRPFNSHWLITERANLLYYDECPFSADDLEWLVAGE